ncbi:hypothetical protein FGB62_93g017 [Gracilaria domingensis]|nr:hypothetical protein FGB62_93g017 [Gracilaria domingensis]
MDASSCSVPPAEATGSPQPPAMESAVGAEMSQRDRHWRTVMGTDASVCIQTPSGIAKKEFKYSGLRYHCKVQGCTQMFRHRSSRSRHQKKFHPGSAV